MCGVSAAAPPELIGPRHHLSGGAQGQYNCARRIPCGGVARCCGYRERALDIRLGTLNLWVSKLRQGSCFSGFLEPRKTAEKALVVVIQEEHGSAACPPVHRSLPAGAIPIRPETALNEPTSGQKESGQ